MDEPHILKIRMPTDYKPYVLPEIEGPQPEPMTLAELNERMKPLFKRTVDHHIAQMLEWEKDRKFWFGPTPKPTRWQKMTYPFRWRWYRIQDAWLVLIGKREAS